MEPSRTEGHQTASQVAEGHQTASQVAEGNRTASQVAEGNQTGSQGATDACEETLDPYPFKEPRDQLQAIVKFYPFYRFYPFAKFYPFKQPEKFGSPETRRSGSEEKSSTDSNRLSDPCEEVLDPIPIVSSEGKRKQQNVDKK